MITEVRGQCETELSELYACGTTITTDVFHACNTCLSNSQVPDKIESCDELESTFCSIVEDCTTACGNCADETERYFDCYVNEVFNCDLNCASGGSGGTGGSGVGDSGSSGG